MNTFKKTTLALTISALAGGALAQSAPAPAPAPTPATSPITANVTVTNDYRYRGISQSNFQPAIQGGFDYAHESGFYIGNWNSSISWISDAYGPNGAIGGRGSNGTAMSAPVEMDFYAGFKKELIGPGFASDIGVLQYYYPTSGVLNNNGTATNPNTTEIYAAQNFTFGALSGFVKFSYAVSTLFGNVNSQGSYYPDLTINYDTGIWGLTANAHVGYQYVAGNQNGRVGAGTYTNWVGSSISGVSNSTLYSYTDWKLGLTKDFGGGLSGAIAYVGTNAATYKGAYSYANPNGKNLGQAGGLISLTKTF
ncbi:Conserved hypothetical protein CHP02001 [Burkholderiaceae bacterium]